MSSATTVVTWPQLASTTLASTTEAEAREGKEMPPGSEVVATRGCGESAGITEAVPVTSIGMGEMEEESELGWNLDRGQLEKAACDTRP